MVSRYPLLPYQLLPPLEKLPKPFEGDSSYYDKEELAYFSTVAVKKHRRPKEGVLTPNFFETLQRNSCLPEDAQCNLCLRNKQGADCDKCKSVCPCYCKTLCKVSVEEKFVSKELIVSPPLYSRDPTRLIPRIIHQTWFEDVTQEKYPNMSRLIESFKQSGWDYRFYADEDVGGFLVTHFPPEVKDAYDALRPGAFKADLFRYCVLLIHGGIYADMDVMLESNLDAAVGPDVGFMVPVDEVRFRFFGKDEQWIRGVECCTIVSIPLTLSRLSFSFPISRVHLSTSACVCGMALLPQPPAIHSWLPSSRR